METGVEVKLFCGAPQDVEAQINDWLKTVPQGSRLEASPVQVIQVPVDGRSILVIKEMSAIKPVATNGSKPQIAIAQRGDVH